MKVVKGRIIQAECLVIDDKVFIDCELIDCVLEYSGRPVVFHSTVLKGCRYVFFGCAKRTVQFLQETDLMVYDPVEWGEFSGEVN